MYTVNIASNYHVVHIWLMNEAAEFQQNNSASKLFQIAMTWHHIIDDWIMIW